MRAAFISCLLVTLGGCYDLDAFPNLYRGDGGLDGGADGGVDGGSLGFTRLDIALAGKIGGGGASNSGAPGGARVDAVDGVCSDGAGGFYITDLSSRTFSSMTTSGTLKRLAGIPYLGGGTDGPLGTSTFGQPHGCVVSGNVVYIADTFGNTIRAYNVMNGTLKTVVGSFLQYGSVEGTGASAKLAYPSQLAMYGSMRLYAIDNGSSNLHIIDTSNFAVTNVGAAPGMMAWGPSTDGNNVMMSSPSGVTVSGNGAELYIADTGNAVILQMDTAAPYTTSLYAGIPGQHGNHPGALLNDGTLGDIQALAFSTDGSTLVATDASWGLLELTSTMISTLVPSSVTGLAVLSSGDVIAGPAPQSRRRPRDAAEWDGDAGGPVATAAGHRQRVPRRGNVHRTGGHARVWQHALHRRRGQPYDSYDHRAAGRHVRGRQQHRQRRHHSAASELQSPDW